MLTWETTASIPANRPFAIMETPFHEQLAGVTGTLIIGSDTPGDADNATVLMIDENAPYDGGSVIPEVHLISGKDVKIDIDLTKQYQLDISFPGYGARTATARCYALVEYGPEDSWYDPTWLGFTFQYPE